MVSEEADTSADSAVPPIRGGLSAVSKFINTMGLHHIEVSVPRTGGQNVDLLRTLLRFNSGFEAGRNWVDAMTFGQPVPAYAFPCEQSLREVPA